MPKRVPNDLDAALRHFIELSPLSNVELARRADITDSSISRFLRGERDLRLASAAKLAKVLGLRLVADG